MVTRLVEALAASPVVGVLRGCPPNRTAEVVGAAVSAGLQVVEVTMDSDDAVGQLRELAQSLPDHAVLGAGTVTTVEQVDLAIAAGATFVVSPSLDADVVRHTLNRGAAAVPGVLTPTEISAARAAEATMCKLFPSGPLGAGYLKALRGPYPDVPFLCTGGMTAANAASFLAAGATAVGMGRDIFDPTAIDRGDAAAIAAAVTRLLSDIRRLS